MHVRSEPFDNLAVARTRTRAVAAGGAAGVFGAVAGWMIPRGPVSAAGPETLARQWFEFVAAPSKEYVVFENSGHSPPPDEPGRFADFMADVIRNTSERYP